LINKDSLKYKVNSFFLLLTAFLLPLHKDLLPIAIGLLFISSIWNRKTSLKGNYNFLYLTIYFLILVFGYFISENKLQASAVIEVGSSMFLFPIIFMISNINYKELFHKIMTYFIEGVILSFFISMILSVYKWSLGSETNPFFYTEVSSFHHTSYMAMYCSIGVAYFYYISLRPQKSTFIPKYVTRVVISVLTIFALLLMSKTGILIVLLTHLFGLSYWIVQHKKIREGLIAFGVLLFSISILFVTVPSIQTRFSETYHALFEAEHSESSTGSRLISWEVSWNVFKSSPVVGVGTGDIDIKMNEGFLTSGHNKLAMRSLNSHNQFLTTAVQSGLFGLIGVLFMFFYPLTMVRNTRSYFYLVFLGITLINFMTESMLQTQSGIIFISFLLSLFLGSMNQEFQNNPRIKNIT
jgi:O-antigen ligase